MKAAILAGLCALTLAACNQQQAGSGQATASPAASASPAAGGGGGGQLVPTPGPDDNTHVRLPRHLSYPEARP